MESLGGARFAGAGFYVRKKRSSASRRPCSDSQKFLRTYTFLSPSTQLLGSGRNEEDCYSKERTVSSDGLRGENRPKKLTLKLGGVTHTIHAKSAVEYAFSGGSSIPKSSQCIDAPQPKEKLLLQDCGSGKDSSLRGKMSAESVYVNGTHKYEPVRKSKRVPKRRVMDSGFNEDDDNDADEEIQYLGRLNASKERRRILKVSDGRQMDDGIYVGRENHRPLKLGKDGRKKSRSDQLYEDKDYMEEELTSDDELEYKCKKLGFVEGRNESTTTRAFQFAKDVFLGSGPSLLEFPDGLPPPPSKKQKAKLSEVEQQLKKAEAAQRRRMQSEKAAMEAEAEAIRKIRGQESGRKKKEEKMKKQRNELAQAKAAKTDTLGSNTVRWVIGPSGTVVIFSDDIGLPNIFNSLPCKYPPPREKCAGPNCTNAYKYRDSKSKLPLCSLHCYKAIHGRMQPLVTC